MHLQHELAFDYVFAGAETLCVLDDLAPGGVVGVHEVGDVVAWTLHPTPDTLAGDKEVAHLLAEVGDKPGTLHQPQLGGAVVLLAGGVGTGLF